MAILELYLNSPASIINRITGEADPNSNFHFDADSDPDSDPTQSFKNVGR
jgi:hypothetical protein